MSTDEVATAEDLVQRATGLVPMLDRNAIWTEQNRRLKDETVEALTDAGVFRMRVPSRYGGYESGFATLVEVSAQLARGDGSAAWVAGVSWITSWMVGMFPDHVQDEVFSGGQGRTCGTLSPSAMATPADGGIVVNGKWGFISGALHSDWQVIIAVLVPAEGEPYPIMAPVPMSDLRVVDDWHAMGLKGSGSVSTAAQDVFVPADRVLPLPAVLAEQYASAANAESAVYRVPLLPMAAASSVGTVVGLARAAWENFHKRLPNRKITYTSYESQREAPLTHLQVADAALKLDQLEFHAGRLAGDVDGRGAAGSPWKLEDRARARADLGAVCKLGKEVTDLLAGASGGTSIYTDVPIQRIARDVTAINLHALMHPATNNELYGRVLCGMEANTLYI